jgi:endonuclease/exonuclease/phosphatase family metal-dependent hydrolase
MYIRSSILILFVLISFGLKAQPFDTLRVMAYNLTNYGNNINPCTAANNGLTLKNPAFKTIVKHISPDILGVCEMNTNPIIAGNFLSNVLNTDGVNHFVRSAVATEPSGTITSVLFYNGNKMALAYQSKAPTQYRLTHHFRLYMKTEGLAQGDTLWLNVLLCHLKAGTASSDVSDRASMALAIRNYLSSFPKKENCIIMGDFNFYRSSEAGFQTLTSASAGSVYQFQDPINRVGSWTGNASFADVHTQCPRTDNNGGCYSGGGLDDRFDFILMNRHLLNDSAGIRFIPGSYKVPGNDGQHFNSSINSSPVNTSAPAAVISALYLASDHLPVQADLRVAGNFVTSVGSKAAAEGLKLEYREGALFSGQVFECEEILLAVFDMQGRVLFSGIRHGEAGGKIALPAVSGAGLKTLRISRRNGQSGQIRLMGF